MQLVTSTRGPDPATEKLGLASVVALIFVVSWPSVIPQILASWKGAAAVPGWVKLLQFLLVAPGVVAVAAAAVNGGWPGARRLLERLVRWRAPATLYAAVLLGPPLAIWLAAWISHELGYLAKDVTNVPDIVSAFVPTFLIYLVLNNEELAWRGYVLPRLQARLSPLAASLVLGLVWTVFHAPYFLMKGGHPGGLTPVSFVILVLSITVLLTGVFNASGGSVLLAHLFHQSFNAWAEAIPYLPRFAESQWPVRIGTLLLLAAALALAARPAMRRAGPPAPPDFSPLAERYARSRPTYPPELFAHLAGLVDRHELAWDAATGNGQAAHGLVPHFANVVATDISAEQLRHAVRHPSIEYRVAPSESSGLATGSVDLVTVAAAVHWFDPHAFAREVRRVVRPGGVLAVFTYHVGIMRPPFDRLFDRFYRDVVGPYFAPQVRVVDELYATLTLPGEPLAAPEFDVRASWNLAQLVDFIHGWSGTAACREATGHDPVENIKAELDSIWGPGDRVCDLAWPLHVRIRRL